MQTIIRLPENYTGSCRCVLNDRDSLVVYRNIITLLLSALLPPSEAADVILHVWYSARLTAQTMQVLREKIRPLILDLVEDNEDESIHNLLWRTWEFGSRKISACLYNYQWTSLFMYLNALHDLTKSEIQRLYVMLNKSRIDQTERDMFYQLPNVRLCSQKMRRTGILLPFGSCVDEFTFPNP